MLRAFVAQACQPIKAKCGFAPSALGDTWATASLGVAVCREAPRCSRLWGTGGRRSQPATRRACSLRRQELAKGDQIGIGALIEPFPSRDELFPEISEMGDRAAQSGQPQS
jgi:hypothetical protein